MQPVETCYQSQTPAKPVENDATSLDDVYCKVKSLIKESFSIILEREMKAVYDDIWLTIVLKISPCNTHQTQSYHRVKRAPLKSNT